VRVFLVVERQASFLEKVLPSTHVFKGSLRDCNCHTDTVLGSLLLNLCLCKRVVLRKQGNKQPTDDHAFNILGAERGCEYKLLCLGLERVREVFAMSLASFFVLGFGLPLQIVKRIKY